MALNEFDTSDLNHGNEAGRISNSLMEIKGIGQERQAAQIWRGRAGGDKGF